MAERFGRPGTTRCAAVWLRHEDTPGGNWGDGDSVRCGLHEGHDREHPEPLPHGHLEKRAGKTTWVQWPPSATVVAQQESRA